MASSGFLKSSLEDFRVVQRPFPHNSHQYINRGDDDAPAVSRLLFDSSRGHRTEQEGCAAFVISRL
jgi:hypothetical protein